MKPPRRPPSRSKPRSASSSPSVWRENVESILWAVALAMLIRTFVIAPFKIPSGSMRPTLMEGDRILVSKFIYRLHPPRRGDVIVFKFPENPKRPFIKRLVGLGRDRVEIRDGHVWINNELPADGRLHELFYYNQGDFGQEHHVTEVPAEAYFVLGDNSSSSHDSRFWGFVPKRLLIGQAVCIFWPPRRIRILR